MRRTIKVRIPAVISPEGKWAAYGYPAAQVDPDWAMVEEVADNGEPDFHYKRVWITAELVLPETDEVEALAVEPDELSKHNEFNPEREYPGSYGAVSNGERR